MIRTTISTARPEDIPDLVGIQTECKLSPWTLEGYGLEMERLDSLILIARDAEGHCVGFIAGRIIDQACPSEAEIYNIGTLPRFQKCGIGAQLLSEFTAICRQKGVAAIWLEVRASNVSAINFYHAHRFVEEDRRISFYSDPIEDAEVMSVRL